MHPEYLLGLVELGAVFSRDAFLRVGVLDVRGKHALVFVDFAAYMALGNLG